MVGRVWDDSHFVSTSAVCSIRARKSGEIDTVGIEGGLDAEFDSRPLGALGDRRVGGVRYLSGRSARAPRHRGNQLGRQRLARHLAGRARRLSSGGDHEGVLLGISPE